MTNSLNSIMISSNTRGFSLSNSEKDVQSLQSESSLFLNQNSEEIVNSGANANTIPFGDLSISTTSSDESNSDSESTSENATPSQTPTSTPSRTPTPSSSESDDEKKELERPLLNKDQLVHPSKLVQEAQPRSVKQTVTETSSSNSKKSDSSVSSSNPASSPTNIKLEAVSGPAPKIDLAKKLFHMETFGKSIKIFAGVLAVLAAGFAATLGYFLSIVIPVFGLSLAAAVLVPTGIVALVVYLLKRHLKPSPLAVNDGTHAKDKDVVYNVEDLFEERYLEYKITNDEGENKIYHVDLMPIVKNFKQGKFSVDNGTTSPEAYYNQLRKEVVSFISKLESDINTENMIGDKKEKLTILKNPVKSQWRVVRGSKEKELDKDSQLLWGFLFNHIVITEKFANKNNSQSFGASDSRSGSAHASHFLAETFGLEANLILEEQRKSKQTEKKAKNYADLEYEKSFDLYPKKFKDIINNNISIFSDSRQKIILPKTISIKKVALDGCSKDVEMALKRIEVFKYVCTGLLNPENEKDFNTTIEDFFVKCAKLKFEFDNSDRVEIQKLRTSEKVSPSEDEIKKFTRIILLIVNGLIPNSTPQSDTNITTEFARKKFKNQCSIITDETITKLSSGDFLQNIKDYLKMNFNRNTSPSILLKELCEINIARYNDNLNTFKDFCDKNHMYLVGKKPQEVYGEYVTKKGDFEKKFNELNN